MSDPQNLAIPLKLDAFILNAAVCGGSDPKVDGNAGLAKIAPITQPNYTFLRFERTIVQNDILNFTDLHKTSPAAYNTRFTDLGTGETHANRQGVYLHWIVPRPYRNGSTLSVDPNKVEEKRAQEGFKARVGPKSADGDSPPPLPIPSSDTIAPDFHPAPPRWLVIRKVESCVPEGVLPGVDAWVVESDRRQNLDDIPPTKIVNPSPTSSYETTVDLQVDCSPYINGGDASVLTNDALEAQAEVFIGYKESANTWVESVGNPDIPVQQRVELNLVNSSNQLFPDFQPHNTNVFSIVDTLQYGVDDKKNPLVVETATVSYYVMGWHSDDKDDLFGDLVHGGNVKRKDRLAALNMTLNQTDNGVSNWMESTDPTRIICHGAMYNVLWDIGNKPPIVQADNYHRKLNSDMPVAVGTTPMDSLLTYISSHAGPNDKETVPDVKRVEQDLLRLQKLLHARDDGVDGQAEADDIVYNWNYSTTTGGSHYFLAGTDDGKRPTAPGKDAIKFLNSVNNQQRYYDSIDRQLQLQRWVLFSMWWQYMSDLTEPDTATARKKVQDKTDEMVSLAKQMATAMSAVSTFKNCIPTGLAQMGVLPIFQQARDPTMLVAGIESGWPTDYLDELQTRVDTQLFVASNAPPMDSAWDTFCSTVVPKLPTALQKVSQGLINEFLTLNPNLEITVTPIPGSLSPLYHDQDKQHLLPDGQIPWRDRWEKCQPWFPLFLEWEAEYTHIPHSQTDALWSLDQRKAWLSDLTKLRYGIAPTVELADLSPKILDNKRTVSGRVLILPQPSLNLKTIVTQILKNLPNNFFNDPDEKTYLQDNLDSLAFLSSPLSGFTDHLLTRVQGNHIKPTVRVPGSKEGPIPFQAAVDVAKKVLFDEDRLGMMGIQTDLTPYGTLVPYLNQTYCPFKPATHGQFRFTALNIIDKFGQAIHAIDPTPTSDGPPALYPCISEYYTPEVSIKDPNKANTVNVKGDDKGCQYVQLPPSINQPARLNSLYVDYRAADTTTGTPESWQPVSEWDDPVWGWVVPNYADSGIQLFCADGTFFREIRFGGPSGVQESQPWLPFVPPTKPPTDPNIIQLQRFADQLNDASYLSSFVVMLNKSLDTAAPPPTALSEFLSSLVGKPLALVKAGYSLELATDQYYNMNQLIGPPTDPEQPLLPATPGSTNHYKFALQLGDPSRVYDGLIGYFNASSSPKVGDALDLSTIYTHFIPDGTISAPKLTKIQTSNYPIIAPFWQDPMDPKIVASKDSGAAYTDAWNLNLQSFGALIDPFVPLHAYTGILPTNALKLPTWTWQTALQKMTAFFHMGPLLATTDVPVFDSDNALSADNYDLTNPQIVQTSKDSSIGVPTMQKGEWAWLQAYSVDASGKEAGGTSSKTEFMALGMKATDERPRFEIAPYTAVEGYMQLRESILQADGNSSKPKPQPA